MAAYFVYRIEAGKLDYNKVVERYPKYKEEINRLLLEDGYFVNADGTVSKK